MFALYAALHKKGAFLRLRCIFDKKKGVTRMQQLKNLKTEGSLAF